MSKWIEFCGPTTSKSGKTWVWDVYSKKDEDIDVWLGEIKWLGKWRKYAFFPDRDMVFEQDCLRDLAQFCEDKTKTHREAKKK